MTLCDGCLGQGRGVSGMEVGLGLFEMFNEMILIWVLQEGQLIGDKGRECSFEVIGIFFMGSIFLSSKDDQGVLGFMWSRKNIIVF